MKKGIMFLVFCVLAIGLSACGMKEKPISLDTKAVTEGSIKEEELEIQAVEEQMTEKTTIEESIVEESVLEDTTWEPELKLTNEEGIEIDREYLLNFYKDSVGVWIKRMYGDQVTVLKITEDYVVRMGRFDTGKWHNYAKVKALKLKNGQLELTMDSISIQDDGAKSEWITKLSKQKNGTMVVTNRLGEKTTFEYDLSYDMEEQPPEGWE